MSYARSPRPVCSMTIGTSIMFSFALTLLPRRNVRRLRGGSKVSRGLVIQKIEGLFAADSIFYPSEASILCQSRPHRFCRLFRLFCERLQFTLHFIVSYINFLVLCHLVEQ